MKLIKKLLYLLVGAICCMVSSCNYLDVVPTEQADADDTMKDESTTLGFLYSCYIACGRTTPSHYRSFEASTDEFVLSPFWDTYPGPNVAWGRVNSSYTSGDKDTPMIWDNFYNYIGQCNLFLRQIAKSNPEGVTNLQKERWIAEVKFLKAYYHFRLLSAYGPIPIVDEYPDQNTPTSALPGRSHFDYTVDYIVGLLDEAVGSNALPASCSGNEWGRATSTVCKALKSRVLLYAASDMWNGKFPLGSWQNENYETPGYGNELVSRTYNEEKWKKALEASLDALTFAEETGSRKLLQWDHISSIAENQGVKYSEIYIPGDVNDEFKKKVLLMRYLHNSYDDEGNKEIIFATFPSSNWNTSASVPHRVVYKNNAWTGEWGGFAPTLYTMEHFYTKNGKLPEKDPAFTNKTRWLEAGNVDREEIINLNIGREPRFYAWLSFDGDDYGPLLREGKPLRLDMRGNDANTGKETSGTPCNGYGPDYPRDYSPTGFLTRKFVQPDLTYTDSHNRRSYPVTLFRLGELYLNVAECYAALDNAEKAIEYLNVIRERAGVPELKISDVQSGMSIEDWVRSERFIELWGEGHRYYDLRRWLLAPDMLKAGVREGLSVEKKVNPTIEEFNQRTPISQDFTWTDKMYLLPIHIDEIYSDPQLVQAPGY